MTEYKTRRFRVSVEIELEALEPNQDVELTEQDAYALVSTALRTLHQEGYDSEKFAFDYWMDSAEESS